MADVQKNEVPQASRPHFAEIYGIDRKKTGGMLPWEWVEEHMAAARNYWISSTNADGSPHAAPVWGVWWQGALRFGTARNSRKGRNLAADPRAAVHLESGDETIIFEGVLEELSDSRAFSGMADAYEAKYEGVHPRQEEEPENVYYTLYPSRVFAWRERDFLESSTVWNFERTK